LKGAAGIAGVKRIFVSTLSIFVGLQLPVRLLDEKTAEISDPGHATRTGCQRLRV